MITDDFARRHGYQEPGIAYENPEHIPEWVRVDAGLMLVGDPEDHSNVKRFARAVLETFPPSPWVWDWFRTVQPIPKVNGRLETGSSAERDHNEAVYRLLRPMRDCDWRLFYTVVEEVCAAWRRADTDREVSFASDFNLLLRSYGIPWTLQGGWVIPVADLEFAEELEHAREVTHPPIADHVKDPHELIRDALAALYRKQGGPNTDTAVAKARDAWRAVVGAVSGRNPEEDAKRAFAYIGCHYPELNDTMKPWQDLMKAARHSANLEQRLPTAAEARFIVMLCVNAVRFLCPTCRSDDTA